MTAGVLLLWLLTAVGGGACAGLVRVPLRLEERAAVAAVAGIIGSSLLTLLLGLVLGLGTATALLGPALLTAAAWMAGAVGPGTTPLAAWRASWQDAAARRWERDTWVTGTLAVFAAVVFWRLFAHTLFTREDGSIVAGFATVWADWSLHSTLASSFAVSGNLPPTDPIFSGGTLRYPFLPDFHSATLEAAGASLETALAVPCAVLCTAVVLLVVSLGRRLAGNLAVGMLAMLLCLVGGGLGFRTMWWDGCDASGHAVTTPDGVRDRSACAPAQALSHPGTALDVVASLRSVAGTQPRSYDNLQNPDSTQISDSTQATATGVIQWYTPLLAWWLPQRTFVYGFAVGSAILLLVVAGLRAPPGTRSPFVAAGLLAGTLPLVHIHTLIALGIVLGLMALCTRRREWLWLGGIATALALPRLLQVAFTGAGVADPACPAASTRFPFFEVGWKSLSRPVGDTCTVPGYSDATPRGALTALGNLLLLPFHADFWAFWIDNQGVVVLVALAVAVALVLRRLPATTATAAGGVVARLHAAAGRVLQPVPDDLLRFCVPFLALFAIGNVVVFQTWDWDNTKLLAWWYLGGALLTSAWVVAWWRRGGWRATLASAALVSLVLSGGLSLTRVAQTEAARTGGPYVWASTSGIALAAAVEASTPRSAVFLLPEAPAYGNTAPNQPIATLTGRASLLGYGGWLYSYGVDEAMRPDDRRTIYRGCVDAAATCTAPALLRRYSVDFVLVPGDAPGLTWFASTYPRTVHSDLGDVFDVRASRTPASP